MKLNENTNILTFHPQLLKIFSFEQLNKLAGHSLYSLDKKGQIYQLFSVMDFGSFEILCGDDDDDCTMINVLFNSANSKNDGIYLNSDDFWKLYLISKPKACTSICIDI